MMIEEVRFAAGAVWFVHVSFDFAAGAVWFVRVPFGVVSLALAGAVWFVRVPFNVGT